MEPIQMQVRCYLVVSKVGSIRVTKSPPNVRFDEVAIGLSISLPRTLFQKPQLSAVLTIPPDAALPAELPVEVLSNVQEAISAATGLLVRVSMEEANG